MTSRKSTRRSNQAGNSCARSRTRHAIAGWLGGLLCMAGCAMSIAGEIPLDLTDMSLEALMDIEITSVAKKQQKKSEAAAAVFVITSEDLQRWGVTNIPDALRRVPGLQVARIDANKWAITARGFNSRFANKLLVLIDGRSVYTPLFAGVYWEANDVMLEDVERIEVIRGPGGTLWGANAVNGVINIITRSSHETGGTLLAGGIGNEEQGFVSARHGGTTSGGRDYRVYGKFRATDTGKPTAIWPPADAHDDGEFGQVGFRMDWDSDSSNSYTLQGDVYQGHADQQLITSFPDTTVIDNAGYRGHNLLYRWTHRNSGDSSYILQAYYDHVSLDSVVLYEDRHTLDLDFQHHFSAGRRHDLVWGLNYRNTDDNTSTRPAFDDSSTRPAFSLTPPARTVNLYTTFVQDDISLLDDRARLTLGTKLEHNDFTGFEAQPNVRLAWLSDSGATLWGAVSRAVRTPSRGEHDVTLMVPTAGGDLTVLGDDDYRSERLVAYELGYRFRPFEHLSVDLAAFHNDYDQLRTVEMTADSGVAAFDNNMQGKTEGIEVDAHWQVSSTLALHANYTYLEMHLDLVHGSGDIVSESAQDASPSNQGNLWLSASFTRHLELDLALRYSDSVQTPGMPVTTPSYLALDTRLGWTPKPGLELSLVVQNLLDNSHPEFNPDFIFSLPTEVERSIFGKAMLKF